MPPRPKTKKKDSSANLGLEAKLWLAADKLRNNMDAEDYEHVFLGLLFHKHISENGESGMAEGRVTGISPAWLTS